MNTPQRPTALHDENYGELTNNRIAQDDEGEACSFTENTEFPKNLRIMSSNRICIMTFMVM